MVCLEWDRGHEEFNAIVRAEADGGLIVTEMRDLTPLNGYRWLPDGEIVDIEDLPDDDPDVRVANILGARTERLDSGLVDLRALLEARRDDQQLVGIYQARTGSDELLVGAVSAIEDNSVRLDEVRPDGTLSGDTLVYDLNDIVCMDWDTDYLRGLRLLVSAD